MTGTDDRVKWLRSVRREGKGAALRRGVACTSGDVVIFTDADLPIDLDVIPDWLKLLAKVEVVIGDRRLQGSVAETKPPFDVREQIIDAESLDLPDREINVKGGRDPLRHFDPYAQKFCLISRRHPPSEPSRVIALRSPMAAHNPPATDASDTVKITRLQSHECPLHVDA
jgi:hypothetical protein